MKSTTLERPRAGMESLPERRTAPAIGKIACADCFFANACPKQGKPEDCGDYEPKASSSARELLEDSDVEMVQAGPDGFIGLMPKKESKKLTDDSIKLKEEQLARQRKLREAQRAEQSKKTKAKKPKYTNPNKMLSNDIGFFAALGQVVANIVLPNLSPNPKKAATSSKKPVNASSFELAA